MQRVCDKVRRMIKMKRVHEDEDCPDDEGDIRYGG